MSMIMPSGSDLATSRGFRFSRHHLCLRRQQFHRILGFAKDAITDWATVSYNLFSSFFSPFFLFLSAIDDFDFLSYLNGFNFGRPDFDFFFFAVASKISLRYIISDIIVTPSTLLNYNVLVKLCLITQNFFGRNVFFEVGTMEFMKIALEEAEFAAQRGSVPVGAVIVLDNRLVARAGNEVIKNIDPTAHAEMIALRRASQFLGQSILDKCDIYVTLEPCPMCAQAISLARIRRLYFGAYDVKYGGVIHGCRVFDHATHRPEIISGVFETQCAKILQNFFSVRR
ncbi:MAG: nucleoside deaminase [Holosporaceae bacterium]|nr:nucleoside deaminase [Holosporaceae bacterium]